MRPKPASYCLRFESALTSSSSSSPSSSDSLLAFLSSSSVSSPSPSLLPFLEKNPSPPSAPEKVRRLGAVRLRFRPPSPSGGLACLRPRTLGTKEYVSSLVKPPARWPLPLPLPLPSSSLTSVFFFFLAPPAFRASGADYTATHTPLSLGMLTHTHTHACLSL